ncbi:MAG: TIGR01777 family oxidoreductase [Desulfoprunum sp.]|jgi:hypothetical protein|uniref:TIGR01777 family oxidoreductase n=1 Tax=Desulfoprunum sp. TaxID=2020866 RepID=UPI00052DABB3|nr:hypothetical protein JT06_01330 [Desulfobulbus sp. Tol-SR]
MKILITGASGLVGSALIESLFKLGHTIRPLRRHRNKTWGRLWDTASLDADADQSPFDVVINLAGENVANKRWNARQKELILRSRVDSTWELVDYISQPGRRPKLLICASATGYYGNCGDAIVDERSPSGSGFLAEVCRQWEETAAKAEQAGIRVVFLRFGMVLSPRGGALFKMLPAFKAGLGGVIGSGNQYIGWISINDLADIVGFVMENEGLQGAFNTVSPIPVTNRVFVKTLGEVLGRPTIMPAPAFLVRLLFGEMADEMVLSSCRVVPTRLLEAGYRFKEQDLRQVLASCTHSR